MCNIGSAVETLFCLLQRHSASAAERALACLVRRLELMACRHQKLSEMGHRPCSAGLGYKEWSLPLEKKTLLDFEMQEKLLTGTANLQAFNGVGYINIAASFVL